MAKIVDDRRARQGGRGRPVLYVLIGSFALIAVYMISALGWSGMTSPQQQAPATSGDSSAGIPSAAPGDTGAKE